MDKAEQEAASKAAATAPAPPLAPKVPTSKAPSPKAPTPPVVEKQDAASKPLAPASVPAPVPKPKAPSPPAENAPTGVKFAANSPGKADTKEESLTDPKPGADDQGKKDGEAKGDQPEEVVKPDGEPATGDKDAKEDAPKEEPIDYRMVLSHRPFMIRSIRKTEKAEQEAGCVLSQSLDSMLTAAGQKDAAALTLAGLRKVAPGMSRYPNIDKFCTPSGSIVDDETITFLEYLVLEPGKAPPSPATASVKLYYRNPRLGIGADEGQDGSKDLAKLADGPKIKADTGAITLSTLKSADQPHALISSDNFATFDTGVGSNAGAGTLNEGQWAVVLRNCAVFYGWIIDSQSRRITRAPKPAFRLRSQVNQQPVSNIPDILPQPLPTTEGKDDTKTAKGEVFANGPVADALASMGEGSFVTVESTGSESADNAPEQPASDASTATKSSDTTAVKPSAAVNAEGSTPLANAAQVVGSTSGTTTSGDATAAKPTAETKATDSTNPTNASTTISVVVTSGEKADSSGNGASASKTVFLLPKSEQGIPNFRVNDDSRIEVTAHESQLSVAMARSDFSESSTEATASGGGFGFSAAVSAGSASSNQSDKKGTDNSSQKTLVARYMFPRCDLTLWPDELEPTPELADLIATIQQTKDIKALRRLQAEFGQLFCQNLTLGGRLLSTKIVTTKDDSSTDQEKESFKSSVGASVSGSYAGFSGSASAKHDGSSASGTLVETSAHTQDEATAFEAVGGDTLLANNAKAWGPTVGRYDLWRVINREGVIPLAQMLAGIPGFEAVQSWFVQAIPALSQYMILDNARECKARFRVISPTNSLSVVNIAGNAAFYLGHNGDVPITPRLNGVNTGTEKDFWIRKDYTEDIPIFNPATYRAPAIFGYANYDLGGNKYGSALNTQYLQTEWTVIAPFDDELQHGTRIILRTSQPPTNPTDISPPSKTSHIVVFRNAQGEFLPAMSDAEEYQYWRLLKVDPSEPHIKPGDEIRLAWDFRDQTTGWRDFVDDVFGRRQVAPPPNTPAGPLLLKVPWPRFEVSGKPTALIMSPEGGDLIPKTINIDQKGDSRTYKYCLQELRLRIDAVGNGGRGDTEDYMLNGVDQQSADVHMSMRVSGNPLSICRSIFFFGLF